MEAGETAEALQPQRRNSVLSCCYWNNLAKSILLSAPITLYIYDMPVTLGEHRNQKYLNSVTTFSPVFTHCPFCISSPPNYKKRKDFYFSSFEKEKYFHFLSCEEREGFSFCNFLPTAAIWAWVSKGLVNTIQLLKCLFKTGLFSLYKLLIN